MSPRASILVPTHNRPETLSLAVRSALAQTVQDIEVIVIGDGVSEATRTEALALTRLDSRVRFLDYAKGPHHGEIYRHDAILQSRSNAIFYLCDDDLLLPEHVADLLLLLESHDLVQSLNGWVRGDGIIDFYPADLSLPDTIAWHLREEMQYSQISLTGTAHLRDFYLKLDDPWATTPKGRWPDHFQFSKFFRGEGFRGATSRRMTALQFPATQDGRSEWTGERLLAELTEWAGVAAGPGGQDRINAAVAESMPSRLERDARLIAQLRVEVMTLNKQVEALNSYLENVRSSRSFRLTVPLRALRRLTKRKEPLEVGVQLPDPLG
jgi:glycosyltransferase involved in cell wall biosynthesis